ncbi:50S ribosomal protein L18 [Candidatus Saccharibacteria bacterium]|nr:MAG: 50S ribosomal protein L18 [Candidatus Saccharibacteria bacterium]
MSSKSHKLHNADRRCKRVRTAISGSDRPRLSVRISNRHVIAQVIDDAKHTTLAYATTVGQQASGTMTERAAKVGSDIAAKAKKAKVSKVVFDRGSHLYHGRVKALAEAARAGGLEF